MTTLVSTFSLALSSAIHAADPPPTAPVPSGAPATLTSVASPNHSPYRVNVVIDVGITVGAMILVGFPRVLAQETVRPWCGLQCNPKDVNPLDRWVIGHESHTALALSNTGFLTSLGLPFLLGAIDVTTSHPSDGAMGYLKDDLVLAETLSITLTTNNVFSFIVRRPRPHTYNTHLSDADRLDANNSFSFPSGHTSASFAMATAYSRIYMLRHPDSPAVIPLWLGTYSVATMTGVFRPLAGEHFWTDVMIGAVTGVGIGLLVPWMHMTDKSNGGRETMWDWSPASFRYRVAPLAYHGGAGAMLIVE